MSGFDFEVKKTISKVLGFKGEALREGRFFSVGLRKKWADKRSASVPKNQAILDILRIEWERADGKSNGYGGVTDSFVQWTDSLVQLTDKFMLLFVS